MRTKFGVPPKKKILVISPDAVPFDYHQEKIDNLSKEEKDHFLNKVIRATSLGERAFNTAKVLSEKFDVTLAVPDHNYFSPENLNLSNYFFQVISYKYDLALHSFSEELDKLIQQQDIVILQTSAVGFKNCINLSPNIMLVVDGWVPLGVERATSIGTITHLNEEEKQQMWVEFKDLYFNLLKRADILLYANMSQKYYYMGILNAINCINQSAYRHSKLIKVGISVEHHTPIQIDYSRGDRFNLVWFGTTYGWYNPFILVDAYKYLQDANIGLTFVGCGHPRFKRLVNTDLLERLEKEKIPTIHDYVPITKLRGYHLAVILAYNFLEKHVAQRYRSLQLASVGIPVCTNKQDNVGMILESYNLCYSVLTYNPKQLAESIIDIRDKYQVPPKSAIKNFQNSLSIGRVFEPLIGYLEGEKKWRLI